MKKLNLTGMRFGMLRVIASTDAYISPKGYRLSQWVCKCDCGATTVVPTTHLTSGHTLSCGCQKLVNLKPRQIKDIVGMKFGMLTVVGREPNRMSGNNSRVVWQCRCDCGKITDVLGVLLTSGYVKSCGCVHQSHAELLFKEWLEQYNFNFVEQYGFKDLLGENNKPLLFDFAVQNKNNGGWILVELDGIQHFQPISWFGGQEKFERVVRNDKRKNDWCRTMNIPLIRINVSSCRSDLSFVREYQEGLKDLEASN